MATLYQTADSNIRKTYLLVGAFLVLIIGIGFLFSEIWQSPNILYFAIIFSVLTSFFSYWYSDRVVLFSTRACLIKKGDNPELYRVVENLCITAGLPFPKVYIIPESQPNAFATGRNVKHAVVAVTQGLLDRLEKAELEGVIAHELSHIKNKDMLLQTMVVVLVGVIALLANLFLRFSFLSGKGNSNRRSNSGGILMLLGLVAAILAPIAATLLKLSISRKREFLADASGALLTRYPEGLAMALEKISADPTSMFRASNSTAHLFISSPFKGGQSKNWFTKLFLTHPPIEERLAALRGMRS
ncbi:zinc metalloprotease HtpX [bacterium (Candidatus Gribaldobacteria) CG23_combo_of_CG06-09_8_20_14_all_37_87_8]|uniref:Protease HtpX homolog n=2 Tax=Candidatus Gribaldobacteria TaxID=2798536 RepID=A0A2G9ZE44_9BACT|nr:MAG: zinc metalloprotease HtpX [Parcubacteria group bacterium CG1_02_37_13]PIP31407.1 MAG: zinc metalloprotease HtpX [bacterium (Candidatus Gribaldobacteria) CG23_combo_of_CG06-09_8_20_14_all_37_87_8]